MNTSMNGKEIARFEYTAADGNPYEKYVGMRGITKIHLSATYHGDRDEFWVVVEKDAQEIERHSCKNVSAIFWA